MEERERERVVPVNIYLEQYVVGLNDRSAGVGIPWTYEIFGESLSCISANW